ncbi:hypothetical protein N7474_004643 [Penicillium riverlandense]|uniref:uncharacterized protein n=1 Tax=Penicillium riverlandense TaxID=1903569 RepID=UPI0025497BCB|nr:uncharacterized protein N7474_004643 [Penicillium riverlandense]KAJ5819052.1 hypothetical protein N7474_004643 [Penicillium riverlandense]
MASTVRNHPPSNLSTVVYPGENDLVNTTDQIRDMDGMDIDSTADMLNLPTESSPAPAAAETTWPTRTAEGIFRHIFLVDITDLYNWNPSELNILEAVHLHLDARLRLGDLSDPILSNPHQHWRLRIAIDTRSDDRGGALADIVFRLSAMQDMIRDGLGWFTGLPWEHKHFEVVVLPPR